MRRLSLALLGLLAAAHVAADGAWLGADEGVQFTDAAYHFSQVVELRDGLFGDAADRARWAARDDRQRYGEAWYYVAAAASRASGVAPPRLLLALSLLLWPLLLFAAFRLGEELAPPGRPGAGLLSAALAGFLPGLFNYTRVLVLDVPLAVAVAWSLVGLLGVLRAEVEGRSTRRAWLLAAGAGLAGLSVKANALAFLIGPLIVAAAPAWRRRWTADRRALLRALLGAGIAAAVVLVWLAAGHRLDALIDTARTSTWPGKALDYAEAGTLSSWPRDWARGAWGQSWEVAYFAALQTFSPPLLLAVLGSAAWFFGRRRGCEDPLAHAQRALVFGAWIVPVVGVTALLCSLYDERYVVPLLPGCAAVVACAAAEIPRRLPRALVAAALVAGAALNFAWISFDALPTTRPLLCSTVPGWASTARVDRSLWLCAGYPGYRFLDRPSQPAHEAWPLADLDQGLFARRNALRRPLRAVYLDDLYGLFYRVQQRELLDGDLIDADSMLLITRCADEPWMASMFGSVEAVEAVIADADVVFIRYGAPTGGDAAIRGRRCRVFWPQIDRFEEGVSRPLEDGTEIREYLRRQ